MLPIVVTNICCVPIQAVDTVLDARKLGQLESAVRALSRPLHLITLGGKSGYGQAEYDGMRQDKKGGAWDQVRSLVGILDAQTGSLQLAYVQQTKI